MKKLSLLFIFTLIAFAGFSQDAAKLKNYVGTYDIEGGPIYEVKVMVKDGKLYGSSDQGEAALTKTEMADAFTIEGYDGTVKFKREGDIVKSMTMNVQGQEMMGMRKMPSADDFAGTYTFQNAPFSEMMVTSEDGSVQVEVADIGKGPIEFTSNLDEFYEPNYSSTMTFKRNEAGEVEKVVVMAQGSEMTGTKVMEKEAAPMEEYLGTFTFDSAPFGELIVTMKEGKLHGNAVGQGEAAMNPTDNADEFEIEGYDGTATYVRNADGKISDISLFIQGSEMKGKKKAE
jgi:hypothetical protein